MHQNSEHTLYFLADTTENIMIDDYDVIQFKEFFCQHNINHKKISLSQRINVVTFNRVKKSPRAPFHSEFFTLKVCNSKLFDLIGVQRTFYLQGGSSNFTKASSNGKKNTISIFTKKYIYK